MQPKPQKPRMPAPKQTEPVDESEDLKENVIALAIVALIVIGAGWWIYARLTAPAPEIEPRAQLPIAGSAMMGSAQAPVTVFIFSDFECSFCARFALEEMPVIEERYVGAGQARIVFKHFPLENHPRAAEAAQAAACVQELAGDEAFWEYHDTLFRDSKALGDEDLARYAGAMGLDGAAFARCMEREPVQVSNERFLGQEAGVVGTPTFFFNGRKVVGFLTAEEFGAELAKE